MTRTRRTLISFVALTLAMGGVASAQDREIRFVWDNLEPETKQLWHDYLLDPFEADNPGMKIDFQPTPQVTDAVRVQMVSPTTAPDMFMADATEIATYVDAGTLLPLDEYVEKYDLKSKVFPWALGLGFMDGHYYSIPHEFEATMMVFNKSLLDANGWKVPRTREEFVAVCDAAMAAGLICIAQGSAGNILVQQFAFEKYLTNYAGPKAVRDLFKGAVTFSSPDIKGAFELLNSDWDKGYWNDRQSPAVTIAQARSLWLEQRALFLAEGTFTQRFIDSSPVAFEWGATSWPSMRDGVPSASGIAIGAVMAVSKYTKHADVAGALMGYMYERKDLMLEGVGKGLQPRATPFAISDVSGDMAPSTRTMLTALLDVTKDPDNVGYAPWTFFPTKTNQYLMETLDTLFYDEIGLDDFLAAAQKVLDAELADGYEFGAP